MRRALAASVLAACLILAASVRFARAQAGAAAPTSAAAAQSAAKAADDYRPPFMRPHVVRLAPHGPDLSFAQKPGPTGFHGLAWGLPLAEAEKRAKLAPVTTPVTLKNTYMRTDERLFLGQAPLRSVAYYFPNGRLAGVGVTFDGETNFFLVKDALIRRYGPGRQIGDRYGWTWKDRDIELRRKDGVGELRYSYEPPEAAGDNYGAAAQIR